MTLLVGDEGVGAGGRGGGGFAVFPVEFFTGASKILVVADNNKFFVMDSALTQIVDLQTANMALFPVGAEMEFLREGVGVVEFFHQENEHLSSRDGLNFINAQYSAVSLKKVALQEWRLFGTSQHECRYY